MEKKDLILQGKTALGIEFGSTRIKAVLIDLCGNVLATGFHDWENSLIDGIWTYSLEEVHAGLKECYASLKRDIHDKYGVVPASFGVMGISAMMHGYLAFDKEGNLLSPFQTWRNSNTEEAADALTRLFDFNIPLRWTVAHLYQRMLDKEEHLSKLDFVTTLDSYVHRLLTGERIAGIGSASGMFPIDSETLDYHEGMVGLFDDLVSDGGYGWRMRDVFPKVLVAGQDAGVLTAAGAKLIDPAGDLQPGIPFVPCEGDAGTGMVATNAVAPGTGNVSAGTSMFAMLVLEKQLSKMYREIDMVTTPDGYPVAMSHANNGTSDLNAWVRLFKEFADLTGHPMDMGKVFETLYTHSLSGDADCGGLLSYGYYSGEGITHINEGRPLFARTPDSAFNLANFMRSHLYTSLGAVKLGMDILLKDEKVKVDSITGHGGLFKTKGVAQRYLSASVAAPVTVMSTASEGGPWGMALLAAFGLCKEEGDTLPAFLNRTVFSHLEGETLEATPEEIKGFETFMERYSKGFAVEKSAVSSMDW